MICLYNTHTIFKNDNHMCGVLACYFARDVALQVKYAVFFKKKKTRAGHSPDINSHIVVDTGQC